MDPLVAVRLASAAQTAADALFNCLGFGLTAAGVEGGDPKDKAVLIWGGASSVGWAAVQLAKGAGFGRILVTASERNHDALRRAGATHCFDYRREGVVSEIRETVEREGIVLRSVFDAVSVGLGFGEPLSEEEKAAVDANYDKSSAAVAKSCISEDEDWSQVRLCSALPVLKDPAWEFVLFSRKYADEEEKHPGWWQRQAKVMDWLIENHKTVWTPQSKPKVVKSAVEAVEAVRDVFEGRVGVQKVVIQHPML